MPNIKPFWKSKTIWVNFLTLMGTMLISYGFDAEKWAEISTVALALVNVILRITTNEGLSLDSVNQSDQ